MRRVTIDVVLPIAFSLVPILAGAVIFAAIPADARRDYLARVSVSAIDWVILTLGFALLISQTILSRRALRWKQTYFDTSGDQWLSHLGQAAEWFPLLGLIGTVAAILQTFGSITPGSNPTASEIISKYAPAITATGSGLFMAFVNILPGWVVTAARALILNLAGPQAVLVPAPPEEKDVPLTPAQDGQGVRR